MNNLQTTLTTQIAGEQRKLAAMLPRLDVRALSKIKEQFRLLLLKAEAMQLEYAVMDNHLTMEEIVQEVRTVREDSE